MTTKECEFCNPESLIQQNRLIRVGGLFVSFVSKPWFRNGHCLVVPRRHITTPAELTKEEGVKIMEELGRLSILLDDGFGSGIMQKCQPKQSENGVKMNHLHFHVFPRLEDEKYLFPVPEPNQFEGFYSPTEDDFKRLVDRLA